MGNDKSNVNVVIQIDKPFYTPGDLLQGHIYV